MCVYLVDSFFSVLPVGIQSNKKKIFNEKIGGIDPGAPKIQK